MVSSTARTRPARVSLLARIGLVIAALSALGVALLLIGDAAGWKGFSNNQTNNNSSVIGDISWWCYFFGGLLSIILGIILLVRSRRAVADRRPGYIVLGWGIAAAIILMIVIATGQ